MKEVIGSESGSNGKEAVLKSGHPDLLPEGKKEQRMAKANILDDTSSIPDAMYH